MPQQNIIIIWFLYPNHTQLDGTAPSVSTISFFWGDSPNSIKRLLIFIVKFYTPKKLNVGRTVSSGWFENKIMEPFNVSWNLWFFSVGSHWRSFLKTVIFIFDTVIMSATGCKAFYYSEEDVWRWDYLIADTPTWPPTRFLQTFHLSAVQI